MGPNKQRRKTARRKEQQRRRQSVEGIRTVRRRRLVGPFDPMAGAALSNSSSRSFGNAEALPMTVRALTKEQTAWLDAHPGWTIVSPVRHHKAYAKAANGKGRWMGDNLLCGDGALLPGTSFQIDERIYVRPPRALGEDAREEG